MEALEEASGTAEDPVPVTGVEMASATALGPVGRPTCTAVELGREAAAATMAGLAAVLEGEPGKVVGRLQVVISIPVSAMPMTADHSLDVPVSANTL